MALVLAVSTAFFLALKGLVSSLNGRSADEFSIFKNRPPIKVSFRVPLTTISCAIWLNHGSQNGKGLPRANSVQQNAS
jgi:hypothetical protein